MPEELSLDESEFPFGFHALPRKRAKIILDGFNFNYEYNPCRLPMCAVFRVVCSFPHVNHKFKFISLKCIIQRFAIGGSVCINSLKFIPTVLRSINWAHPMCQNWKVLKHSVERRDKLIREKIIIDSFRLKKYTYIGHWIDQRKKAWESIGIRNSPRASYVLGYKSHEIALSNLYIEFIVQRIVFNLFKLRMHSPSCTRKSILRKLINLCKSNTHKNRFRCSFPTSFYMFEMRGWQNWHTRRQYTFCEYVCVETATTQAESIPMSVRFAQTSRNCGSRCKKNTHRSERLNQFIEFECGFTRSDLAN